MSSVERGTNKAPALSLSELISVTPTQNKRTQTLVARGSKRMNGNNWNMVL